MNIIGRDGITLLIVPRSTRQVTSTTDRPNLQISSVRPA
ncbi:hypothetical protein CKA32_006262 [Geitlerinema sp. FC II]|nr:hypothetical protein CKA32_006262 [Geitlerinema sp. FC II]